MVSREDIKVYHCPTWNELPDLDLYMDQVMSVLDKNLKIFISDENEKSITPTMINNYVKQKLVSPPKNKKYNRGHIASFFIITLLKQIMPIPEIKRAIDCVLEKYDAEEGYDLFCSIFENSLRVVFSEEDISCEETKDDSIAVIRSITLAYSNMLYSKYLLEKHVPKPKEEPKEKKKKN